MNISWLVENHVILVDPGSGISLDDLMYLNEEVTSQLDRNEGLVHLIVLTGNVKKIPINLPKIKQIIKFPMNPNTGWIIAIAPGQLVRTMVGTLSAQTTLKFVQNYDSAVQFVLGEDDTIPEFPTDLG